MPLPANLGGIVPPVCTPLTTSHEVDVPSLRRLIAFLLEAGVHGLFMLGSTSETALLTDRQRASVLEVAVEAAGGRVPVLAGVIDTSTARSLEQARTARRIGVDALVLTAPFYVRASQSEIAQHFRIIQGAVDLPIVAYDIPSAVQVKLERATVLELAREGAIVGIKDSSGDEANFRGLVLETRELSGFRVFTGSELIVDLALQMGAHGSVPGLGNVDPAGYVKIYDAVRTGDLATARAEQERRYRLFSIVYAGTPGRMGFTSSALGAFKTALVLRGVIATNVPGQPLTRLDEEEVERVRAGLIAAGLLSPHLVPSTQR
ncbi:MAG: 4-hydroxy-tetrahydrodipicolinate synthase [Thermomicrobiales bacterium]|nr:4-hydroxy-tetrahydrodipicolinate synthase [Thermomicrobiales bacterium]